MITGEESIQRDTNKVSNQQGSNGLPRILILYDEAGRGYQVVTVIKPGAVFEDVVRYLVEMNYVIGRQE